LVDPLVVVVAWDPGALHSPCLHGWALHMHKQRHKLWHKQWQQESMWWYMGHLA
jgi:hypothetical protein